MSLDKFHLRKNLYLIGQNMGKTDVSDLKFLCDYELPKRHLEKIETAFELFCALEEASIIDLNNQTRLIDLLQSMSKGHLLNKYPLHNIQDSVETDRGGRLSTDIERQQMRKFLLRISNDMSKRDLRNLICFVYDLIPDNWTLIDMDSIKDGSSVFKALMEARLIGPNNMKLLEEVFEIIGRNDLCQMIRERPHFSSAATPSESGTLSQSPNSLPYPTTSSEFTTNSSMTSSSSSEDNGSLTSVNPLHGHRMSLDHGGSSDKTSSVTPPQAQLQSPYQPMTASVGGEAYIYHGLAAHHKIHHRPHDNNPVPSAPLVNSVSLPTGNHGNGTPSSSVSGSSNPYQIIPQPETFGKPHLPFSNQPQSTPTYPCQPEAEGSLQPHHNLVPTVQPMSNFQGLNVEGGGVSRQHNAPVLIAQSEQDLIQQLEEKERQLKESDHMKGELLSMMEFQRELMNKLMNQMAENQSKGTPPLQPLPPQPNQYPMTCAPHGLAVIIGNDQFSHNPKRSKLDLGNRKGSDLDMINYENIFSVLGYDVRVFSNQTAIEIDSIFQNLSTADHSSYDSFVMCITTHGESNSFIFGSDSVSLDLYQLIRRIQGCQSLINKPKLFFVQACRMPSEDVVMSDNGGSGKTTLARNIEADVFIAWATSRNQAAYRSQQEGSWFVSALRYVFGKHAMSQDLVSMMYEVTRLVTAAEGRESGSNDPVQQCVETSSQLRGPVRFL